MTPAQALRFEPAALPGAAAEGHGPARLRLLNAVGPRPVPAELAGFKPALALHKASGVDSAGTPEARVWPWILLAVAAHGLVLAAWLQDKPAAPRVKPQEIELVKPAEPLKELPKVEPPKPLPQQATPPQRQAPVPPVAAARTAPAEAAQPNTVSVPENLSAPHTPGPVVAAPPAPPPPPPAPKVEEVVTEPNAYAGYLNNPPPVYPKSAQRQGLQGRVLLRVQVLASGQPGAVEIKQSSGKPALDEAALAAVKSWSFVPAKKGSTPIEGWTTVPIDFKLAN